MICKTSLCGENVHHFTAAFHIELNGAVSGRKDRIVAADPGIVPGEEFRSALTYDDRTGCNKLTAVTLDTQVFGVAVTTVVGASLTFFMCHIYSFSVFSTDSAFFGAAFLGLAGFSAAGFAALGAAGLAAFSAAGVAVSAGFAAFA